MAKRMYIGVGGKAHKVKKMYFGVGGKARKIKKAYIGIGGVARPCWSGGELAYYGAITALSSARRDIGSASVGNYALFAGGYTNGCVNTVDAYSASLVRSLPTALSQARRETCGASAGGYALFAGGDPGVAITGSTTADAYNTELSRISVTGLSVAVLTHAAVSVGSRALFAGGRGSGGKSSTVDSYDENLTRSVLTPLEVARPFLSGAASRNYAIFGGGHTSDTSDSDETASNAVDAYDAVTLTRTSAANLSVARSLAMAASNGKCGLFCGGGRYATITGSVYTTVDAYDENLTHTTPAVLSAARNAVCGSCAASLGENALIAGGAVNGSWGTSAVVDAYDDSLTRKTLQSLSASRATQGAVVGEFALFGGGYTGSGNANSVEAFTLI